MAKWDHNKIHAVYKGDKFVDLGTFNELAERLGMAAASLRWYKSPSGQKRAGIGQQLIVFEIEEDDDETVHSLGEVTP